MVTDRLSDLVVSALKQAAADGVIPEGDGWAVTFERPRRRRRSAGPLPEGTLGLRLGDGLGAPVAQGIEHAPPERGAQVRILPGAQTKGVRGPHQGASVREPTSP